MFLDFTHQQIPEFILETIAIGEISVGNMFLFHPTPRQNNDVDVSKQASRPMQLKDRFDHNAIYLYNLINLPLSHLLCRCRNTKNAYPYISRKTKQMAPRTEIWARFCALLPPPCLVPGSPSPIAFVTSFWVKFINFY